MPETDRPDQSTTGQPAGKKPYLAPKLTECGSVAKLTMAKGTTQTELSQVVKKQCL